MSARRKPRYQQLKESIIARISAGELKPRDRVPSENELADAMGVSRMTANRALRELNNEGYVERVAGVGTFVADLKTAAHLLEVQNIADEILSRGHAHGSIVLHQGTGTADLQTAEALKIGTDVQVFHILLAHSENGIPIQIEDRYVQIQFAPDFLRQDFTATTPSAYLSAISPLQETEHVVRATIPDNPVRRHLRMEEGEPCLLVMRRTWVHGRPVSFARLYHPGDRYELTGHHVQPGARGNVRGHAGTLRKGKR